MKKIVCLLMVIVMCFAIFGCTGNGTTISATPADIMAKGPDNLSEWHAMLPDDGTIFKNGKIVQQHGRGCSEEALYFWLYISNVTVEEYDEYVKQATDIFPNVTGQYMCDIDGAPYCYFYSTDVKGKYQLGMFLMQETDYEGNKLYNEDGSPTLMVTISCKVIQEEADEQ